MILFQAGLADVTDPDSLLAGNLGLAVFLWEAHFAAGDDEDQPDFYFGLFDLNAWYQAQMPSCVELPEDTSAAASAVAQQCPYFSFTSLEDVVQGHNSIEKVK